jgi:PEGA domain
MKQLVTSGLILALAAFSQHSADAKQQEKPANTTQPNVTRASTGRLRLASKPPGAEVSIDGKTTGQTPLSVDLPAGMHEVVLKKEGYRPWKLGLKMTKGENSRIGANLRKETEPEQPK